MRTLDESVDLNLLRYMLAMVEELSVTRAAARMDVTQSAMSAALKRLRTTFHDPILVRTGQAMTPTPYALEMAHKIRPMLETVRAMAEPRGLFDPTTSQRTFGLMGSDYVQFFILPALVGRLEEMAPHIGLQHYPADPKKVETWMQTGEVDLGIGYLTQPPASLKTRLLLSDEQVCIVRKEHPVIDCDFDLDRYASLSHVVVSPAGAGFYGARVEEILHSIGVYRKVALTLSSFLAAPFVVAQTDFVAMIPTRMAEHFTRFLPLRILKSPIPLPSFELSLFWHERVHTEPANIWLRTAIVKLVRELTSPAAARDRHQSHS